MLPSPLKAALFERSVFSFFFFSWEADSLTYFMKPDDCDLFCFPSGLILHRLSLICQEGTVIETGVTAAALDQIMQDFPTVFHGPQFLSFLAVFFFFQYLPKMLIFIEISRKLSQQFGTGMLCQR